MQIIYPGDLAATLTHLWLIVLFSIFVVWVPLFLVMHFLMPKKILEKYWTEKYFQDWERAVFSYFPGVLMRTVMLTSIMTFPKKGKKRKMSNINLDTPNWYRIFAKTYTIMILTVIGIFFLGFIGLFAHMKISGRG